MKLKIKNNRMEVPVIIPYKLLCNFYIILFYQFFLLNIILYIYRLGTEDRNSTTFQKYTIYIIEVMIADIYQKIFVRYSEMVEFADKIQKTFKDLKVPNLSTSQHIFTKRKTKTIE